MECRQNPLQEPTGHRSGGILFILVAAVFLCALFMGICTAALIGNQVAKETATHTDTEAIPVSAEEACAPSPSSSGVSPNGCASPTEVPSATKPEEPEESEEKEETCLYLLRLLPETENTVGIYDRDGALLTTYRLAVICLADGDAARLQEGITAESWQEAEALLRDFTH